MMWIIWTSLAFLIGLLLFVAAFFFFQRQTRLEILRRSTPQGGFVEVDDLKIHYMVQGNGPDLILVHGLGANLICWRHLMPLLSQNFTVWALDLPGFGKSSKPRTRVYGLEQQSENLRKFMDVNGIKKPLLVGNSMGAAICGEVAIRHPQRTSGLVLLNSAHDSKIVGPWDVRKIRTLRPLVSPLVGRQIVKGVLKSLYGTKQELPREIIDAYLEPFVKDEGASFAFIEAFEAIVENEHLIEGLSKFKGPVMVLWGRRDRLTPLKFGEDLARRLGLKNFYVHPEAGHHMQEEVPEWITQHILEFVRAPAVLGN
ncbi:MAG: alpha/beta fold hydrolase [Oligoflexia bacterium]|nr:alpha/beta fold hydrolase [Oligoflexia bacterium]